MLASFLATCVLAVASPASSPACVLTLDAAQSHVEVAVTATVDSFVGHLARYDASVGVAETGEIVAAQLRFRFRDLETGKEGRDKAMHKWQQSETFPDGEFVLSSLEPAVGNGAIATGQLKFHGVAREVRFPVSVLREGARYAIDGHVPIDTRDYGLPIIRMLGLLKVDPLVQVRFHLQGTVAGGKEDKR